MEKWRCRGKNTNKVELNHDFIIQQQLSSTSPPSTSLFPSEKKGKRWSFGGLLKRISKNETPTINTDTLSSSNNTKNLDSKNNPSHHVRQSWSNSLTKTNNQPIKNDYHEKVIKNVAVSEHESQDSCINYYNPSMHSRYSESSSETFKVNGGNNSRRNLIKARIKAKRDRYCENSSSTDDENNSNCSFALIQSEDNLRNMYRSDNNRRTRGARTERYIKRLHRDDSNGSNDNHEAIKNSVYNTEHLPSMKSKKKYPSDILSPYSWTANDNSRVQSYRKTPAYFYQLFNNERNTKSSIDSHDNESVCSDKCTRSLNRGCRITPITDNSNKSFGAHIHTPTIAHKVQLPPPPPPRSAKSRLFTTPLHHSTQNSDVENGYLDVSSARYKLFPHYNNVNCNSLDRIHSKPQKNFNHQSSHPNKATMRHSFNGELTFSLRNNTNNYGKIKKKNSYEDCIEAPIVPNIQKTRIPPPPASITPDNKLTTIKHNEEELERKRHSKNLEEALEELETIYNSLHLNNDEDLLDRAEKRSMDEYRDKIATTGFEGSIKSSSDTSSSYEISRELAWRNTTTFDQCHTNDTRLKDDMAYRRIHQNERSSSADPNQMSLSEYSYLAASPILSRTHDKCVNDIGIFDQPKSRRGTPDLMRDDVVYRTINHANNTLKIIEPQPPFGIPIGPVTTAAESDYLHIDPTAISPRSSYIPQSEPDIVTDDLAFRNLRKDTTKDRVTSSNTNFIPRIHYSPEMKKKRAVRSLSADLYGIINKSNDKRHAWYKEFVKLNTPTRLSDGDEGLSGNEINTNNSWMSNREYFDLDINGNRPKSTYQGRIQVCIPQEEENLIENKSSKLNEAFVSEDEDKHISSSSPKIAVEIPFVKRTIEPLTENNELTEYKELCHNLECLINKISEKAKSVDTKSNEGESRKNSLDDFVEWEDFFLKDDAESANKVSDEPLKLNNENEIGMKQIMKEEKVAETQENDDKILCKFADIYKELCDSPENSLPLNTTKSSEELKNEGKNVVIAKNKCRELNLTNNVPCKLSDIIGVTNDMEIMKKNNSLDNINDNNDSSSSNNMNEHKITVDSDKTKDLMVFKSLPTSSLSNTTNNDNEKEHNDCIHESSISEGEEFGNECIASSSLCQTSYKQIVNVCLLNTNSLSTYYVALWSVCLTLLIAIIVAR